MCRVSWRPFLPKIGFEHSLCGKRILRFRAFRYPPNPLCPSKTTMNRRIRERLARIFDTESIRFIARQIGQTDFRTSMALNVSVAESLLEICQRFESVDFKRQFATFLEGTGELECAGLQESNFGDWKTIGDEMCGMAQLNSASLIEDIAETGQTSATDAKLILQVTVGLVVAALSNPSSSNDDTMSELELFARTYVSMSRRTDITGWYFLKIETGSSLMSPLPTDTPVVG